jgi:Methionyl-tRNA synthetase
MSKRFYITTAIDYVNGQPHLGHAYEKRSLPMSSPAPTAAWATMFFF